MAAYPVVHLEYTTSDPLKAREFYGPVFGWKTEHDERFDYVQAFPPNGPSIGFPRSNPEQGWNPGDHTLYLGSPDLQASLNQVAQAGGQILVPATDMPGIGSWALFSGPGGVRYALFKSETSEAETQTQHATIADHPIVHIEFLTDDPASASQFAQQMFGWQTGYLPEFDYHTVLLPNNLGGAYPKPGAPGVKSGTVIVYIGTADLDATARQIEAAGGRITLPKTEVPGMGWMAHFTDPTGNLLGLWQTADPNMG